MAISGQRRTNTEFEKYVGVFEAKVLAVNPTREELDSLLGTTLEKDPEYFVPMYEIKNDQGQVESIVKKLTVNFWVEDIVTKNKFSIYFTLMDKNRRNREDTKNQYINSEGMSSWDSNGDTLMDWFVDAGGVRVAKIGEAQLYDFLRSWLLIDFKNDPNAELSLDWNRLMRNDLREIKDLIGSELDGTVFCLATIKTVDGDNGPVEKQGVYNGKFLPGSYMRPFTRQGGRALPKQLAKYIKEVTDEEYGCQDFFLMEPLQVYNPNSNPANSDTAHIDTERTSPVSPGEDDASY